MTATHQATHTKLTLPAGYYVTGKGRVVSTLRGNDHRELSIKLDTDGYACVDVSDKGTRRRLRVHRLVAHYFLPSRPSQRHEICHIDGNKLNNDCENLRWGTRKENADDRTRHGRTSKGEKHSAAIKASAHRINTPRGKDHYRARATGGLS